MKYAKICKIWTQHAKTTQKFPNNVQIYVLNMHLYAQFIKYALICIAQTRTAPAFPTQGGGSGLPYSILP